MTKRIVIDPGHFPGYNPYCIKGYYEGNLMWDLANLTITALGARAVEAISTRPALANNPSFEARGKMAQGCDMFLSLHTNAAGAGQSGKARGTEVLYSTVKPNDKAWAGKLSEAISSLIGIPDRGAKCNKGTSSADAYGVFNGANKTNCPRMFIVESAFHDNPEDAAWLTAPGNLQKLADTIADTVCDLLDVVPPPAPAVPATDTPSDWAAAACDAAVKSGLIKGDGNGWFGWQEPVTLERLLVILSKKGLL